MFSVFSKTVYAQYNEMAKGELFVTEHNDDVLFQIYLGAFPEGTDLLYRTRTEHNCQCCKHFIRRIGKLVALKDGKVITVWDDPEGKLISPYKEVAKVMCDLMRRAKIISVFRTKERTYGIEHNYSEKDNRRYEHFHAEVSDAHRTDEPDTKIGEKDTVFQVLKRGLTELRISDFDDVLDLIESNGLYKGEEFKPAILSFKALMEKAFKAGGIIDHFVWEHLGAKSAKFRSTAIGNLFIELAAGKDFEAAVKSYESTVAPMNYQRPTTVITQKMVEGAVETLNTLGLGGAIYRRYADISDVNVTDVLYVDNDSRGKMKGGDGSHIAQLLEGSVKAPSPEGIIKRAVEIKADDFVKTILNGAKSLGLFLENRLVGNFVSLTAPKDSGDYRLFKWDNLYAWSYDGDVTDSVKQRVKAAGGNIEALLRVSLSWTNFDDLDLHCVTPNSNHIYFGQKQGILDVDMNAGHGTSRSPVENLAFNHLDDGVYKIHVNQYAKRESTDVGFAIEVEFGGRVEQYSYKLAVPDRKDIHCFDLTVKGGKLIKIKPNDKLDGGNISKEKWGVKTETLVGVKAVMYSPNHWNGQGIDAKHLIFALDGCKNPGTTRGIYNQFLRGDLSKHSKVFEVLGSKTKCAFSESQVSGVGFTSARNDTVTVVVDGRRSYTLLF